MHIAIADVLTPAQTAMLVAGLKHATFVDGRTTAGTRAARMKKNVQAKGQAIAPLAEFLRDALLANAMITMATRPKSIIGPTFSRYLKGDAYGTHVDEPIMDGQRTDIAFTVFLSDPASYDGGALIIDGTDGENAIKLKAGSAYFYPATTLHRVDTILRGERLAAVGWVRSLVRQPEQRELLFDLDTVLRRLSTGPNPSPDVDMLAKTLANLIRMWADD